MFQRLAYSFEWNGDDSTEEFKDSSAVWLNAARAPMRKDENGCDVECEMVLTQWKIYQRVSPELGEGPPIAPIIISRVDLGGGSADDETMDAYPLAGWVLGTPDDGATPFTLTQLYGEGVAWKSEPGTQVVTLAGNPGCAGCLAVPCKDLATLRILSRVIRGPVTPPFRIRTNVIFWLRPYQECMPCK